MVSSENVAKSHHVVQMRRRCWAEDRSRACMPLFLHLTVDLRFLPKERKRAGPVEKQRPSKNCEKDNREDISEQRNPCRKAASQVVRASH